MSSTTAAATDDDERLALLTATSTPPRLLHKAREPIRPIHVHNIGNALDVNTSPKYTGNNNLTATATGPLVKNSCFLVRVRLVE